MKAINIKVDVSDKGKITDFIKSINTSEEMAAYPINSTTVFVAAIGECGIAYAKAVAVKTFDNDVVVMTIK